MVEALQLSKRERMMKFKSTKEFEQLFERKRKIAVASVISFFSPVFIK